MRYQLSALLIAILVMIPGVATALPEDPAIPETSAEFCAQKIADDHIKNGMDTRVELEESGINGRPGEIIEAYIKAQEDKAAKAAAARRAAAARQAAAARRGSTTTAASSGSSKAHVAYRGGGAEQWRSLVAKYFRADRVDAALYVIQGESGGNPNARGPVVRGGYRCLGLFQQHEKYWAARAKDAGFEGASPFNPEANIAVSAMMSKNGTNWSHWSVKPPY